MIFSKRRIKAYIRKFHRLLDAKDAPHSVAGGTSIGVFFGFLPIFGLKTLGAMGISLLTRCSVVASVIGVSLHDLLLPIWPLILRYQFQVGFWILSHPHHFAPPLTKQDFHLSELLQWDNFIDIGLPLLIGGAIFATPVSLISYGVVLFIMNRRAARKNKAPDQAKTKEPEDSAWEQP
jgi:uncharacterized protein (DUF2062 family)